VLVDALHAAMFADPAAAHVQLLTLAGRFRTDPALHAGSATGIVGRPAFLDADARTDLERDLVALQSLLLSLPYRLHGGDAGAMCDALGMSPFARMAIEETWRDNAVLLSRTDLMRTTDGFRVLEYNLHSSLGGVDSGPWHRAYLDLPLFADFASAHDLTYVDPIDGVGRALHAAARQRGLPAYPTVAVVDWPSTYPRFANRLDRLARLLATRGFDAFACHAGELSTRDRKLYARGRRVDILYRIFLVEQVSSAPALLGPVLSAHRAGTVLLAMSFLAELIGNKGTLAMLRDPAHAGDFSDAERATVERLVPWTALVGDPPPDELPQDELVLKPVGGWSGRGVTPGWTVDRGTWLDHLAKAAGGPWVLQRRVRARPEPVPEPSVAGLELSTMDFNWGAFLAGDQYDGMMVRAVRSGTEAIISTAHGASIGGCFTPAHGSAYPA
jgi:hypothetical protein